MFVFFISWNKNGVEKGVEKDDVVFIHVQSVGDSPKSVKNPVVIYIILLFSFIFDAFWFIFYF